jgi:hypothetical protein
MSGDREVTGGFAVEEKAAKTRAVFIRLPSPVLCLLIRGCMCIVKNDLGRWLYGKAL